jgi:hypothetical protein
MPAALLLFNFALDIYARGSRHAQEMFRKELSRKFKKKEEARDLHLLNGRRALVFFGLFFAFGSSWAAVESGNKHEVSRERESEKLRSSGEIGVSEAVIDKVYGDEDNEDDGLELAESVESVPVPLPEKNVSEGPQAGRDEKKVLPMKVGVPILPKEEALVPVGNKSTSQLKEVRILPVITFYDATLSATYNWWHESQTLSEDAFKLSQSFGKVFAANNGKILKFINPHKEKLDVGVASSVLELKDFRRLATVGKAELLLVGDVVFDESTVLANGKRLRIRFEVLRAPSFRKIAEIYKVVDLYPIDYLRFVELGAPTWSDIRLLVERQLEEYKPIVHRASQVELIVSGDFTYEQLDVFKKRLKGMISGVKSISEKYVEKDSVGMFVEFEGNGASAFSQALRETRLEGFMTQVVSSTNSAVLFDVRPLRKVK